MWDPCQRVDLPCILLMVHPPCECISIGHGLELSEWGVPRSRSLRTISHKKLYIAELRALWDIDDQIYREIVSISWNIWPGKWQKKSVASALFSKICRVSVIVNEAGGRLLLWNLLSQGQCKGAIGTHIIGSLFLWSRRVQVVDIVQMQYQPVKVEQSTTFKWIWRLFVLSCHFLWDFFPEVFFLRVFSIKTVVQIGTNYHRTSPVLLHIYAYMIALWDIV